MKQAICSILILLSTISCIREIELDYPPVPPKIVLNASVSPEQDISAFVSKTWFLLDSVPDSYLPDATIHVYINDNYKGVMKCVDDPKDTITARGQYQLPGCRLQTGDHLLLKAEAPGYETATADVEIPPYTPILSLDTVRFQSTSLTSPFYNIEGLRFLINMKKGQPGRHYYRVLIERIVDYEKNGEKATVSQYGLNSYFLTSGYYLYGQVLLIDYEDPIFQITGVSTGSVQYRSYGIFTDNLLGEQSPYKVRMSIAPVENSYRSDTLSTRVTYKVHLLTVSESYYQYFRMIGGLGIWLGNVDLGDVIEPEETYSNVYNGFGVVTGYQRDTYSITMPYDVVPPSWDPWNGYTSW
ncbi:DUF4249 domain-containing protein [Parabacteroides bouchesdurhonensis]|uniref:DUF4249 domain-containing protein n=1 Tax=Parabacteroides bouchesdurhonensis TaxID=1936995 RepID=UPI000C815B0A|nr:DUF4249 domain-containing protein [Parabacteroides bouchesdurhonensis]